MVKRGALLLLLVLAWAPPAAAHVFELTDVMVYLESDGTFLIDVICDLDALALGVSPSADSAALVAQLQALTPDEVSGRLEHLRGYFDRRVRVFFDDEPAVVAVSFPDYGRADAAAVPTFFGLTARLEGRVPDDAHTFGFRASRSFPTVRLIIVRDRQVVHREIVEKGERSSAYPLDESYPTAGRLEVIGRYLRLGFQHILPEGLDHIFFVLGLFLLSARWRPLLWQVSAFTAAHTVTLALATYGVVDLPARLVEPLIALSIAYVAVENVFTDELKPWRVWLVFAFGLLHGLGFAGVLAELGLPRGQLVEALLAFNAGVELGQLAVILLAFLALGAFRHRQDYRRFIVVPASLAIALIGLLWAVERVLG